MPQERQAGPDAVDAVLTVSQPIVTVAIMPLGGAATRAEQRP